MTTWRLSRLAREWVGPIAFTADEELVTGWTYVLVPIGTEPSAPEAISLSPASLNGGQGVLVGPGTAHPLTRGEYSVWLRYEDDPEAPVVPDVVRIIIR